MHSKISRACCLFALTSIFAANAAEPAPPSSATSPGSATAAEANYFKTRDDLRRRIEAVDDDAPPRHNGIRTLNRQLEAIVGQIGVDGFPQEGSGNVDEEFPREVFREYIGGVHVNGSAREHLYVTTKGLLDEFLPRHPDFPKTVEGLSRFENFYMATIGEGAELTNYADIPVRGASEQDFTYAFLGGFAQDYGPFVPDYLIVLASRGNRIFLFHAPAKTKMSAIPECKKVWDDFSAREHRADQIYIESRRNNEEIRDKALDEKLRRASDRIRDQGWVAYCACYRNKAKDQPFFSALTNEAQSVVNRLH